jgi:hypothetical protein
MCIALIYQWVRFSDRINNLDILGNDIFIYDGSCNIYGHHVLVSQVDDVPLRKHKVHVETLQVEFIPYMIKLVWYYSRNEKDIN